MRIIFCVVFCVVFVIVAALAVFAVACIGAGIEEEKGV